MLERLSLVPPQSTKTELLDRPDNSAEDLDWCFRDLQFINRFIGGINPVKQALKPYLPPAGSEINLLDVASGVADVPLALAKAWSKQGYKVNLTVVDLDAKHIAISKEAAKWQIRSGELQNFEAQSVDIFSPQIQTLGSFDFVTCSLAFHHFSLAQRLQALAMMAQTAKRAFVVNDLERNWFSYYAAHLLGLTVTRSPLVRHDAPLSVLRSFTKPEMEQMAINAGLPANVNWKVKRIWFVRLLIVGSKTE
jgi:2-polyprenyl-3-methyl-5-hydroxy-6-metoxy-1,4-benzoquinol methylase